MAKRVLDTDWLGEPRIEPSPSKVNRKGLVGTAGPLRYLSYLIKLTHMEKIQVYLRKEELDALRKVAARSRRSVAALGAQSRADAGGRRSNCNLGWRA